MYKVSKLAAGSVIAATAALGGASVALADGYSAPRVAYERPADWSGVYFGVSSGYQLSEIPIHFTDFGTKIKTHHDDALVDAHLGLQHQFGVIVVGVEGGWASTFRTNNENEVSCPNPAFQCSARLNDILTLGGRLGYAAGRWMPYVTGGHANAGWDFNARTVQAFGATLAETAHGRTGVGISVAAWSGPYRRVGVPASSTATTSSTVGQRTITTPRLEPLLSMCALQIPQRTASRRA
jgi:outer membrane immunogenic protein